MYWTATADLYLPFHVKREMRNINKDESSLFLRTRLILSPAGTTIASGADEIPVAMITYLKSKLIFDFFNVLTLANY
jgi:hypothetical protein